MSARRCRVIPDILEEHFAELQFHWRLRQEALRSPNWTLRSVSELDERVAAHADGLVIGGRTAALLLKEAVAAPKPEVAFAAAYPLLAMRKDMTTRLVMNAFLNPEGGCRAGLGQALCHTPLTARAPLEQALTSGTAPVAAAAAEVLAFHAVLPPHPASLARLLESAEAGVRQSAWRTVALGLTRKPQDYAKGLQDPDRGVCREALLAAAWGRSPELLDLCRHRAAKLVPEHWEEIYLLAVLGNAQDLPHLLAIAKTTALGPQRFQALGSFGHPGVVEVLLAEMASADAPAAAAAGNAFTKITGWDVASDKRATVPPADGTEPDEVEKEFLEEVTLPDPELARTRWAQNKDRFAQGTRWCRGQDVSQGLLPVNTAPVDMESRWEACLRGRFTGSWQGKPQDLQVFPQRWRKIGK